MEIFQLNKEIIHERVVINRMYKRSVKSHNIFIKSLCGERTSALMAFLVDYDKERAQNLKQMSIT